MIGYYDKQTYLKLVKKQIAVYERFVETIDLILERLPENGKRFGTKWFDAINEELKEKQIVVRPTTTYTDVGISLFYTNYEPIWVKSWYMSPDYEYERKSRLVENGIMRDNNACVKMLTSSKERLKNYLERLNGSVSNIDAFIAKWNEFDKISNDLRKFNMWDINVPYIGQSPILEV